MSSKVHSHPCLSCGACCSAFRVSFHWSETLEESFHVPVESTLQITPHHNAMKGTDQGNPHCVALVGEVGKNVACSIYERRPSCCRNVKPSYENGRADAQCDKARVLKGLAPLTPKDWRLDEALAAASASELLEG